MNEEQVPIQIPTKKRRGAPPERWFKKGNPGRPKGIKNKSQILKEKLLTAALAINLDGKIKIFHKNGKIISLPEISRTDLLKIAASLLPKEQTVKMDLADNVVEKYAEMSTEQLKLKANELLNPKKD